MAVPTWKRTLSQTEYIREIYELNKQIGRVVAKCPVKYRQSYGDKLIGFGLDALRLANMANHIYVKDYNTYTGRRTHLYDLRGTIDTIATTAYLLLELVRDIDGPNSDKVDKWEEDIGDRSNHINAMVRKVMEYDSNRYQNIKNRMKSKDKDVSREDDKLQTKKQNKYAAGSMKPEDVMRVVDAPMSNSQSQQFENRNKQQGFRVNQQNAANATSKNAQLAQLEKNRREWEQQEAARKRQWTSQMTPIGKP